MPGHGRTRARGRDNGRHRRETEVGLGHLPGNAGFLIQTLARASVRLRQPGASRTILHVSPIRRKMGNESDSKLHGNRVPGGGDAPHRFGPRRQVKSPSAGPFPTRAATRSRQAGSSTPIACSPIGKNAKGGLLGKKVKTGSPGRQIGQADQHQALRETHHAGEGRSHARPLLQRHHRRGGQPLREARIFPRWRRGASSRGLWEKGRKYLFNQNAVAQKNHKGALHLAKEAGVKRIAIIGEDSLFSPAVGGGRREWAKKLGLTVVLNEKLIRASRPTSRRCCKKSRRAGRRRFSRTAISRTAAAQDPPAQGAQHQPRYFRRNHRPRSPLNSPSNSAPRRSTFWASASGSRNPMP